MNRRKECALVQDLLPSYLDKLTNDETNEFIERHLEQCEECRRLKRIMQKPLSPVEQAQADMLEALRRRRRRSLRRRWIIGVFSLLAVFALTLPIRLEINHTVTATLWVSGQQEAGSQTMEVQVKGVYYDYLVRRDFFEGTMISEEMEIIPGNATVHIEGGNIGFGTYVDDEGLLRSMGTIHISSRMRDFMMLRTEEDGRWSSDGGKVLTGEAKTREEAVKKSQEILGRTGGFPGKGWEGAPN